MSKRKTRTRVIHGCRECRIKHTKCALDNAVGSCKRCLRFGLSCEWDSRIKFKAVTSITEKLNDKKKQRVDFIYDPEQTWVNPSNPVSFHTSIIDKENRQADIVEAADFEPSLEHNQEAEAAEPEASTETVPRGNRSPTPVLASVERPSLPPFSASFPSADIPHSSPGYGGVDQFYNSPLTLHHQLGIHSQSHSHSPTADVMQPSSIHGSPTVRYHPQSFVSEHDPVRLLPAFPEPRVSSLYHPVSLWPKITPNESKLLKHYVDKLSAWIDATDSQRHFATEVVRRSAHYPVLLYSIFAFASLHMSRMQGADDLDASEYHNRCLSIIIRTLEDEQNALDENLLAAIVILRGYEEISELDPRTHIQGSTRLLNSSSKFASSGGLGEAACWITLRQEIYISLTTNQPINTNLEHYEQSQALIRTDHDAWANRIVLIFAKILSVIFRENVTVDWHGLKQEVEDWFHSKPGSFTPIILPTDEEEKKRDVFPKVWMLDPAQVVGLQNYYMARIVLATFDPRLPHTGFQSFRARKEIEEAILKDLRQVLGLATHNAPIQSALFQASHILSMCGFCLRDKREQEGAIAFLENMERQTGWRTGHIIHNLKAQWS